MDTESCAVTTILAASTVFPLKYGLKTRGQSEGRDKIPPKANTKREDIKTWFRYPDSAFS